MKKYFVTLFTILMMGYAFGQSNPKTPILISPDNVTVGDTCTFVWTFDTNDPNAVPDYYRLNIGWYGYFSQYSPYPVIVNNGNYSHTLDITQPKNIRPDGTPCVWQLWAYTIDNPYNPVGSNNISFTYSSILPVELNSFNSSVNNNTVNLSWNTATEINNYGFDVERSSDNKNYSKIGFVKGNGNSNSPKDYFFTDQPTGSTSFCYRLKQIDNSGAFVYSDVITVTLNPDNEVKLLNNYPNPFNPSTAIKFYVPTNMRVTITIYNILGEGINILTDGLQTAGYHIVYWNGRDKSGSSVASGTYLYRIEAGNYSETRKMNLLK